MTAISAKELEVIADERTERRPAQLVYDKTGHRELLADLAEWAREIRSRPWEGAKPWPTSSP
jgi:hypothetical protein